MKNIFVLLVSMCMVFISCRGKKAKSNEPLISAISIIKGQLKHLDTSFYQILKFETIDDITDTTYLKREDVRKQAYAFLSLPDITQNDYSENYIEDRLIDEGQNTLSIIATAKDGNQEIQKQIIIIPMDEFTSGKVASIYMDRITQIKDSSIQQKLFWQIGHYFQIVNMIQKGNAPEKVSIVKVKWD